MGFWTSLGKIGSFVAAPFTGGASLAALPALGAIGSGQSAGRAKGRADQANFNLLSTQAQQGANVGTSDANIRLQQEAARAHAQAIHDALQGGLLTNTQDAHISGLPFGVTKPTITGGLRPSALGGGRFELGNTLQAQGINNLHAPPPTLLKPESFSNLAPKPGKWDKLLNILGTVGQFSGAFGQGDQ